METSTIRIAVGLAMHRRISNYLDGEKEAGIDVIGIDKFGNRWKAVCFNHDTVELNVCYDVLPREDIGECICCVDTTRMSVEDIAEVFAKAIEMFNK